MTNPRRIEYLPLSDVRSAQRNVKEHDLGALQQSISRFGFNDAVIVDDRTGNLVSGHGRVEALRAMHKEAPQRHPAGVQVRGEGEHPEWLIPVQRGWSSKNDSEAEAFLVAANRLVELGGWDDAMLERVLVDLAQMGPEALIGTGFDGDDIDKMINDAARAAIGATDPDDVPEPGTLWVKPGDLFALGEHRLLCGDSTRGDDIDRVCAGVSPDGVWTDPPYGLSYESRAGKVHNDAEDGLVVLLDQVFGQLARVLKPGAFVYVAHPDGPNSLVFYERFMEHFIFRQGLAWVKDSFVFGRTDYHYMHEPIIYGLKPAESGRRGRGRGGKGWYGDNAQTSVFAIPRPKRSEEHPTMKPVELVEAMLRNSSAPGHVLLEPFSGSGTTLMACERLQRRCCAIELDPVYVQRTIARWEAYTQRKAVKT